MKNSISSVKRIIVSHRLAIRLMFCKFAIAFVMPIMPLQAAATLMTFAYDGYTIPQSYICSGDCPSISELGGLVDSSGQVSFNVTVRFTIDTDVPDADPSAQWGRYEYSGGGGIGLSLTAGSLTLFTNAFQVNMANDLGGSWCGSAVKADLISITSSLVNGYFSTCDTSALLSDANLEAANLALFKGHEIFSGESLSVKLPDVFGLIGSTQRIYRVSEPSTVLLLLLSLSALGLVSRNRRKV